MANKILITTNDYQRLTGLIGIASLKEKMPESVNRLQKKFMSAKMLAQDRISPKVITMNSRVQLKDMSNNRQAQVTITYPHDSDPRDGKISVLSPVGIALLGCQVGDNVSWEVPSGIGNFEIVKIIYQPEAVGHYHL